jgi:hypothetical protein
LLTRPEPNSCGQSGLNSNNVIISERLKRAVRIPIIRTVERIVNQNSLLCLQSVCQSESRVLLDPLTYKAAIALKILKLCYGGNLLFLQPQLKLAVQVQKVKSITKLHP